MGVGRNREWLPVGMRFVLGRNENGLELDRVEIVAQPHEYTENH